MILRSTNDHCRQIYERRAGLFPWTQTVRAECGAGYLFVTAGEDGNWRSEGQRGFGCMA